MLLPILIVNFKCIRFKVVLLEKLILKPIKFCIFKLISYLIRLRFLYELIEFSVMTPVHVSFQYLFLKHKCIEKNAAAYLVIMILKPKPP